jgi:hypothetical protein
VNCVVAGVFVSGSFSVSNFSPVGSFAFVRTRFKHSVYHVRVRFVVGPGVLAAIYALILHSFCAPRSCNMSFRAVGAADQVGRGVGSSLFGVILFLCLICRSYSGVCGVLAGIFARMLSRFCGPISCNMSFRDADPSLSKRNLFRNISLVYGKPTCLEKGEIFGITELYRYGSVVYDDLTCFRKTYEIWYGPRCFGMSIWVLGCLQVFRNRYPY